MSLMIVNQNTKIKIKIGNIAEIAHFDTFAMNYYEVNIDLEFIRRSCWLFEKISRESFSWHSSASKCYIWIILSNKLRTFSCKQKKHTIRINRRNETKLINRHTTKWKQLTLSHFRICYEIVTYLVNLLLKTGSHNQYLLEQFSSKQTNYCQISCSYTSKISLFSRVYLYTQCFYLFIDFEWEQTQIADWQTQNDAIFENNLGVYVVCVCLWQT